MKIKINDLYDKLSSIESLLKAQEKRELLEPHYSVFCMMEEHAQNCKKFQGFEMVEEKAGTLSFNEPTVYIKCSCHNKDSFLYAMVTPLLHPVFFKQSLKELNEQYKKTPAPPIPKPKTINNTDRLEIL